MLSHKTIDTVIIAIFIIICIVIAVECTMYVLTEPMLP